MAWGSKAERHRQRAARALVDDMKDPDNRRMVLYFADAYETLAIAEESIALGPDVKRTP